jgi:hypothetical protein
VCAGVRKDIINLFGRFFGNFETSRHLSRVQEDKINEDDKKDGMGFRGKESFGTLVYFDSG